MKQFPENVIRLTGRAPISIRPEQWPVIVTAQWVSDERVPHCSLTDATVTVRQHADGERYIVHGVKNDRLKSWDHASTFAGRLVNRIGLYSVITQICLDLGCQGLAERVMQDLPPEPTE